MCKHMEREMGGFQGTRDVEQETFSLFSPFIRKIKKSLTLFPT